MTDLKEHDKLEDQAADVSVTQIDWIKNHVLEFDKIITPDWDLGRLPILSRNTCYTGYELVSRFSDMLQQSVDERLNTIESVMKSVDKCITSSLLADNILQQVETQLPKENTPVQNFTDEDVLNISSIQLSWIKKHIKNYFKAKADRDLTAEEFLILGMNTIIAGYYLQFQYATKVAQDLEQFKALMLSLKSSISTILGNTFLNKEILSQLVAEALLHVTKNKLVKNK